MLHFIIFSKTFSVLSFSLISTSLQYSIKQFLLFPLKVGIQESEGIYNKMEKTNFKISPYGKEHNGFLLNYAF